MARERSGLKRREEEKELVVPTLDEMNRKLALAQKTQRAESYLKTDILAKKTEKAREYLMPEKFAQMREKVEHEFGASAMKELAKKLGIKLS